MSSLPCNKVGMRWLSSSPWNVGESVVCHFQILLPKHPLSSSAHSLFPCHQSVVDYPVEDSEVIEDGESSRCNEPGFLSLHLEESYPVAGATTRGGILGKFFNLSGLNFLSSDHLTGLLCRSSDGANKVHVTDLTLNEQQLLSSITSLSALSSIFFSLPPTTTLIV